MLLSHLNSTLWKHQCYPTLAFNSQASEFLLQTDASAVGLGAVLEQDGHVIAYASRSLTSPEWQYSVIQRGCLAVVYASKQFRHYLLGRRFKLLTDHAPLQWLSPQKMEGMLCCWALAMQEYNFKLPIAKAPRILMRMHSPASQLPHVL